MARSPSPGATRTPDDATRPLRIVHVFRDPVGGLFRHVRDLCRAQTEAGHQVGIICDATTGGAFEERLFAEMAPDLALGLHRLPMQREIGLSDFATARRVAAVAKTLSPDVLHGHGAKGGAYARIGGTRLRASGSRVARIYTPHGGSLHYDSRGLKNRVYFMAERWLGRRTDGFIFVSRYEAYAFSDKVHKPRVVSDVVPNGLRPEEYEPIVPAPNARQFVFIGMMRDLKGPDVFIKALAQLKAVGLPVAAHMVGSGPDRDTYRDLVAALGLSDIVTFHDPIVARDAFPMGKVLIVPSRAESMPYIVLEAAAAGVPMIATKVGGIPEIFDEQWKRLVEPGDVDALATAMEETLSNPQPLLDATAALRDDVRQMHTVDVMAAAIEALYRAALQTIPTR